MNEKMKKLITVPVMLFWFFGSAALVASTLSFLTDGKFEQVTLLPYWYVTLVPLLFVLALWKYL